MDEQLTIDRIFKEKPVKRVPEVVRLYRIALDLKRHKKYKLVWMKELEKRGFLTCSKCGYNKCFAAIDFHHTDPNNKAHGIGNILTHKPTEERLKELDKVIPLCANCHREIHFSDLPLDIE